MSSLLPSTVQSRPFAVPIKRYAIRPLVHLIEFLQIIIFDRALALCIEKSKRDLVLRIWLRKQVLEGAPIEEVELARSSPVCDAEKDGILLALDLVLYFKMPHQPIAQDGPVRQLQHAPDSHNLLLLAQWH